MLRADFKELLSVRRGKRRRNCITSLSGYISRLKRMNSFDAAAMVAVGIIGAQLLFG